MALKYGRYTAAFGIVLAAVLLVTANVAWAQDDELAQLRKEIEQLKQEQAELKAANQKLAQEKRDVKVSDQEIAEIAERLSKEMEVASFPEWMTRTRLEGYLRYRHEIVDDDAAGRNTDRNRSRISARIGMESKVNDEVTAYIGLATGALGAANSRNQTLTGAFGTKAFNLDLAYVTYTPKNVKGLEGLAILGGKIPNVLNTPVGNSDLIWDTDAHPEGIAAAYSVEPTEGIKFLVQGGGFYVMENSDRGVAANNGADQSLWAAQAALMMDVPGVKDTSLKIGGGYYDYANIKGTAAAGLGNSTVGPAGAPLYKQDFDLLEGFAELKTKVKIQDVDVGLSAFGHMVRNEGATSNQSAWLVGGSAKWDKFKASYNYRSVDADAIFDALVDGDFATTNVSGHKIGLAYNIAKNWDVQASAFVVDRGRANLGGKNFKIWRLDLIFKF